MAAVRRCRGRPARSAPGRSRPVAVLDRAQEAGGQLAPIATAGWRTVVRPGRTVAASGMSSKPTTATSSGTRSPASAMAWNAPSAMRSLAANTPSTRRARRGGRPSPGGRPPPRSRPRPRPPGRARARRARPGTPRSRSRATVMSRGPLIVARRVRPASARRAAASARRRARCRRRRSSPPAIAAIGRPSSTTGMPAAARVCGSGWSPCSDTRITPSRWPARANRSNRSRSASPCTMLNTSCTSCSATAACAPRSTSAKCGSAKNRSSGSATTNATEPLRRVISARAARLVT